MALQATRRQNAMLQGRRARGVSAIMREQVLSPARLTGRCDSETVMCAIAGNAHGHLVQGNFTWQF